MDKLPRELQRLITDYVAAIPYWGLDICNPKMLWCQAAIMEGSVAKKHLEMEGASVSVFAAAGEILDVARFQVKWMVFENEITSDIVNLWIRRQQEDAWGDIAEEHYF